MALTAGDVLTRVKDILHDTGAVRWTEAELLRWLNDGRRELCIQRPDIYAYTAIISLIAGTKQSIPSDGERFIDATRNFASDGVTPGRAVRIIEREHLDAARPAWHTEAAGSHVKHFMFDERVPKTFYVYPAATTSMRLEIVYSQTPVEITLTTTELVAEALYVLALIDYVLYRAYSKDAEDQGNAARAVAHYQAFKNLISEGDSRDVPASPNAARADGTPARGG